MLDLEADLRIWRDHDAIRKLSVDKQKELQKGAAEKIAKDSEGITIVDTHAMINTPNGYLPGLPEWVVKALNPQIIVIVDADTEEIIGRRNKDETRQRDDEDARLVQLHQQTNLSVVAAYCAMTGATMKVIFNHDNGLTQAAQEFEEMVKRCEQ